LSYARPMGALCERNAEEMPEKRRILLTLITHTPNHIRVMGVMRRHSQQSLPFPNPHGGRRPGAGRPRLSPVPLTEHRRRAEHDPRTPAHVTVRLFASRSLRTEPVLRTVRGVLRALRARRTDLRITAFSLSTTICTSSSRRTT